MSGPRVPFHALSAAALIFLAGCQTEGTGNIDASTVAGFEMPQTASAMPGGTEGNGAPAGFVSFCLRNPNQCTASAASGASFPLSVSAWAKIQQTNRTINVAIQPEDDIVHYGHAEYWTIPTDRRGDCEDYALTKRMELIKAGFPARALRLALAVAPAEDRHVVLTIVTDTGDYVLDNLTDEILPWNKTGYVWLSRQDPADPWAWVTFARTTPAAMSAARTARRVTSLPLTRARRAA